MESTFILEALHLYKSFGPIRANVDVTLKVMRGTIHALFGENGAGKTTLMKQVYGLYKPDSGRILLDGKEVTFHSPADAVRSGVYMVTQNFSLIPRFKVWEQIIVLPHMRSITQVNNYNESLIKQMVTEIAYKTGLTVDPDAWIEDLSMGERQRVEIVRALVAGARLLILDEPTSVLTPQESDHLFLSLRNLIKSGTTVLLATHKLDEVLANCDWVTVLRQGRVVCTRRVTDTSREQLVSDMVGSSLQLKRELKVTTSLMEEPILRLDRVSVSHERSNKSLQDISLTIHSGEILCVAGVAGNGQNELGLVASGILKPNTGRVFVSGKDMTGKSIDEFINMGVAFVPDDAAVSGVVGDMTVGENLILKSYTKFSSNMGLLEWRRIKDHVRSLIREFDIRPPNSEFPARLLSGGNLQKLVLARELSSNPKALIAMNPTRGLDIATTHLVHRKLLELRDRGCGIMLVSEDLDEVLTLADRVAVIFRGKITGEWKISEVTKEVLGLKISGAGQ